MSVARFAGAGGTAYVGSSTTAIHAGAVVDHAVAAACAAGAPWENLVESASGWTDGVIVSHDPETSVAKVAVIGDAVARIEDDDGIRTLTSPGGWRRESLTARFMTLLVDPSLGDGELIHHLEGGVVPASSVARRIASVPADEADPFDTMFGLTVPRSVEHAAVRSTPSGDAPSAPLGVLVFDSGQRVVLDRTIVLGRRPHAIVDHPDAPQRLVRLQGADISRQHAVVRVERWSATIDDLGSANGTLITLPGRPTRPLAPGTPADLVPGAIVHIGGDVSFVVEAVA